MASTFHGRVNCTSAGNEWGRRSSQPWVANHLPTLVNGVCIVEAPVDAAPQSPEREREISDLQVICGHSVHDAVHRLFACFLRRSAASHQFHHQKRAHRPHDRFTQSRGRGTADLSIHKQPGTENGAVAHASMHFVGQSAGCAPARKAALIIKASNPMVS